MSHPETDGLTLLFLPSAPMKGGAPGETWGDIPSMNLIARCSYLGLLLFLAGVPALRAQDYYTVQQIDAAKATARSRHLPIAWLSSHLRYLNANYANEPAGSDPELTVLALNTLQGQAVVIFQDGDDDLPRMPQNMVDRIETKDEGELPGGWHYNAPKIIYVDPDLRTFLGCTLAPDVRSDREAAINTALLHIKHDPQAQALIQGSTPPAPFAAPGPVAPAAAAGGGVWGTVIAMASSPSLFIYAAGLLLVLIMIVVFVAMRSRSTN
jgi:hypothetical protein